MSRRIRVLIADDHPQVRSALASMFDAFHDLEVVGQAENGSEAVDLASRLHPDVVLMDYSMPEMDGVEATRRIIADHPESRVVGLSLYAADIGDRLVEAGAVGCLRKVADPVVLLEAVRLAADRTVN